jgi:alpha-tubulin suppressor-like RCC1 family protein
MPLTKITSSEISTGAVTADKIATNVSLGGPKITTVNVANSAYTVLDDTAVNIGGGYIVITGSGFESGAQVIIDTTTATSVAYVNNTTLRAEVPSKSAASYNLYVVNPDGGTAIRVNGLTYSANPTWVTASPLANWSVDVAANVAFSATGATSYSNTTALPAGTQLLSNGYFYGTVTGISVETQYTFTVRATDAENQESDKSFSVTVTVAPTYQLFVWGQNNSNDTYPAVGVLGLNDTIRRSSPVQLGSPAPWTELLDGRFQYITGGIKNGQLWLVGNNSYGELGVSDQVNRSSPVQVGSSTNWSKVTVNNYNDIFAIKTDGTLWAWGRNQDGRLGLSDTIARSSPVQVGSSTNWSKISGFGVIVAVKTDGTLWAWGHDPTGNQTMPPNYTPNEKRSSPAQVGSDTNWSDAKMGFFTGIALKTNGTVWMWGRDAGYGVTGGLSGNEAIQITQLGSGTDWSKIHAGFLHHAAIKTNGTLWLWGTNNYGKLGLNSTSNVNSPTQLGTSSWSSIGGADRSVAIKSDGTLWMWGGAYVDGSIFSYGNGDNTTIARSSPVQIGSGTGWNKAVLGVVSFLATKQV